MGLSNRAMTFAEALDIGLRIRKAKRKFGKHGAAPVDMEDAQQAIAVLVDEVLQLRKQANSVSLADETIKELKAENTKLKQRISGFETANKKLRAQIEDMTDANPQ